MDELLEFADSLIDEYNKKAAENWENYQISGMSRYLNAFHRYNDMARICRYAIDQINSISEVDHGKA